MKNVLVSKILQEISYAFEILDMQFKPMAYARAARSIEGLSEDVSKIYEHGGLKALDEIPGVGRNISLMIEEIIKTGRSRHHDRLMKKIPFNFIDLMNIQGIGPKTVKKLHAELGIKSLKDLEKAAKEGRIKKISGFKERKEQLILENIKMAYVKKKRSLLLNALKEAEFIKEELSPYSKLIEIAGSIRRMKESVADIDILVCPRNDNAVKAFLKLGRVIASGKTKCSVRLESGINSDLRIIKEESFGAALQYFTGSKDHNIALRIISKLKGLKLSEYGLFENNKMIAGRTEKGIYNKLGLQFIPPELRENHGEIQAARMKKIPELIPYNSIKGDLHCHTNYSDGANSIKEMALKAKSLNYEYIGITDHAGKLRIANSMNERKLIKQAHEIKKMSIPGIRLLRGAEVNILEDGSLDVHDRVLKVLDFVVAGIHAKFSLNSKAMTDRLIRAMENPYVKIIAHPTGRKILQKTGCEFDWPRVFEASKRASTYLEVNACPARLDLSDADAREALKAGCKLAINTDAHSASHLEFMRLGIGTARRAWAREKDVINTLSLSNLLKAFKIT